MRNTTKELSRALPLTLRRAAILATLSTVAVVGTHAAEVRTIAVSEAVCLSCAYDDGLPRTAEALAPVAPLSVETSESDAAAAPAVGTMSTPDRSSPDRARLILPSRRGDRSERLPWSPGEKALMWSFVSLSAVDAYQTMNAPDGVAEANPLLGSWAGEHPSALETVAFKTATTYGLYYVAGKIKKRGTRRVALILMNFVQASVVAHNESVTGGSF